MIFENKVEKYLNGKKFSAGLSVKWTSNSNEKEMPRLNYLENIAEDKNIIHVGCVDHLSLVKEKIEQNIWLHKRLDDVANRCIGIDINTEGLNFLRNDLGYNDVYEMDIINDAMISQIKKAKWDYLILGEILEHVDDPTLFLSKLRENFKGHCKSIVITVPNAFKLVNFRRSLKNEELINTDHRFWFTPYTLAKVCTQAGMSVTKFEILLDKAIPRKRFVKKFLLSRYPLFRDIIVMQINL
jgi:hypothetical protein